MAQSSTPSSASTETPSASALNVARCRAIAAHDPRAEIRGADTLAEFFLDEPARQSLVDPVIHGLILKKLDAVSPGGYEYFIARTAYMDGVVEQALRDNLPQIVFLGAGYDTRACRFSDLIRDTRLFELDMPATQQHKRGLMAQASIEIPPQLTFVALDFNRDSLAAALHAAGYSATARTLFVWEGVTYYLPSQTVEETLAFIRQESAPGSVVCFDYMLPASDLDARYGARQSRDAMRAMYTAEPLFFEMAEDGVASFLAERGFALSDHVNAAEMHDRYLALADGTSAGQVLDLFNLAQAQLVNPA